jgi:hypothetical protein
MVDREARERIPALEAHGLEGDREIADLSERISRLAATLEARRPEASGARVRVMDSKVTHIQFYCSATRPFASGESEFTFR